MRCSQLLSVQDIESRTLQAALSTSLEQEAETSSFLDRDCSETEVNSTFNTTTKFILLAD